MSVVITLMAEWREDPLWVSRDGGVADPYDVDEISEVVLVEDALLRDIAAWNDDYQATYRPDDPASSGFADETDRQAFLARGRDLAQRLRQVLDPAITVEYAGDGSIPTELVESTGTVTYYAKIDESHPRSDPRGVVRRRIVDGVAHDEAFTRNLRWEPTEYLRRYRLGHDDVEHVTISKEEADAFVERMARQLGGGK